MEHADHGRRRQSQISRRDFLRGAAAAGAGLALGWPARPAMAAAAKKPNFLVIVADDMGYSDIGSYGGEIVTPNLDTLAAGGLRFTQFYSTGRCWPSRTAILTGYYPQQVRMDPPQGLLPSWTRVMPAYFKPVGYRCYHSGKWHLHGAPAPVADGGFDRSYCIDDHNNFFAPKSARLDDKPLPPVPEGSKFYLTTNIAQYGIDFLKEHQQGHGADPFILYLCFTSPHFPLHAMQEDIDRYKDKYKEGWDVIRQRRYERQRQMGIVDCALSPLDPKTIPDWNAPEAELQEKIGPGEEGYAVPWDTLDAAQKEFQAIKMSIHAAMVDRMDREIGHVLEQVRAMGAFEDTVIFFVSDNGASAEQIIRGGGNSAAAPPGSAQTFLCLGPGWSTSSNTPFRLHKSWNHEGGISSPLIVHWPAGLKARGELRKNPGHFIDLLPTMIELAGASVKWELEKTASGATPDGNKVVPPLEGRSLVPAFTQDGTVKHDYIYFHHNQNQALRVGDWKLVEAGNQKGPVGPWELYDLKTDRCEQNNLAARQPERVRDMAAQWETLEKKFRDMAGPPEPGTGKKGKKKAGNEKAKAGKGGKRGKKAK